MRNVRIALVVAVLASSLVAPSSRAADAELRASQAQLEVERRLLDAVRRRRLQHVEAETAAAAAVAVAARGLEAALAPPATQDPAQPPPPTVDAAERALASSERALVALLVESRAQALELETQSLRVAALEAAVAAYRGRSQATPLDGDWDVTFEPGPKRGVMRLTQVGTLVTGQYDLVDGSAGSVQGTLAAGTLRLERIDASAGRDAVLEGRVAGDRADGTWIATIFGRGTAEAGTWTAMRKPVVAVPDRETPPEAER